MQNSAALRESEAAEKAARIQGGGISPGAAREVRNSQQLIAAAQATINQGNAKLRALGAVAAPKGKKR
jgi:hypothetical protein